MTAKVAFITGSAKRIGAVTATYLHDKGFNIVLHCHHSIEEAESLLVTLNSRRENSARLVVADVREIDTLAALAEQVVAAFGRLDVLVNNASSFYPTPVGSITQTQWQDLFGSNVQAPLFLSQHLLTSLTAANGAIINMVDIHAERPLQRHTVYSMAKAALVTMTKSLAIELAPKIRVNGVAPGAILWPEQPLDAADKEQVLQQIPAKSLGTPEDIAHAIHYLCEARYVTGHIISVDGGRSVVSSHKV
ncbi:3-oxoacyl-[acyl-carrier-protein] reductase FabG [Paraglaciecola mesophila]|uniref:3-oxoacyl-[acyl-carrier-protein] reductase FabG n=1 Tax=Paraglaciecola mesophila TaxID=197222 RepID=A0A857JHE7_9ALTE|nr:pteridine reductase [Paraglaciecola mesophila]QHJ10638.1 3-oxoacyl-[acyl-carrier-protein] reductase FabG [Paraglaciecola mesophila]